MAIASSTFINAQVRTHVNPHGGLKPPLCPMSMRVHAEFGPTLILTED